MINESICNQWGYDWDPDSKVCSNTDTDGITYIVVSGFAKDHPYDAIQSMLEEFGKTFDMDTETPSTLTFYMPSDFHASTSDTYTLDQAISRLKNGMITTFGTGGTDGDGVHHYMEGHIEPLIDDTYISAGSVNVDRIR